MAPAMAASSEISKACLSELRAHQINTPQAVTTQRMHRKATRLPGPLHMKGYIAGTHGRRWTVNGMSGTL